MSDIYTPTTTISSDTIIRKTRSLILEGEVLVREGQRVEHDTLVATAQRPGKLATIRVTQQLGIEPVDIEHVMKVRINDKVARDQVIAENKIFFGLITQRSRTVVEGTVEFISKVSGHVGIRQPAEQLEVRAYVPGTVVEVLPGKGVVIECSCAAIQGLFGVGGERSGTLRVSESADAPGSESSGSILAMNTAPTAQWLRQAAQVGVKGVVCPTIDDRELSALLGYEIGVAITGNEQCGLSLVLTEGFGSMKIAPRTWNLLKALNGRHALINGTTQVRAGVIRPELLVPRDTGAAPPPTDARDQGKSGESQRMRLLRAPYFGLDGHIVEAPVEPQKIATGARVRVFEVRLADGRKVVVPRANVEVLE